MKNKQNLAAEPDYADAVRPQFVPGDVAPTLIGIEPGACNTTIGNRECGCTTG